MADRRETRFLYGEIQRDYLGGAPPAENPFKPDEEEPLDTQLPNCIPASLHCTPIEPCPTINPPCHGQQYAAAPGTAATVCTQYGCHTHVHATNCPPATVCPQPTTLCPPPQQGYQQAQPGPGHTHVYATNCPPMTVCPQPTTLCPPQNTAATLCTQAPHCHQQGYQQGYQQAQPGPGHTHVHATNCPPMTVCPQPTTLCPPAQYQGGGQGTAATVCTQYNCPPPCYGGTIHPTLWTQIACPPPPSAYCPQPQYGGGPNTQLPQCQPNTTLCIFTVNSGQCVTHPPHCPQGAYGAQGGGHPVSLATQCPTVPPLCPHTHWQCPPPLSAATHCPTVPPLCPHTHWQCPQG